MGECLFEGCAVGTAAQALAFAVAVRFRRQTRRHGERGVTVHVLRREGSQFS